MMLAFSLIGLAVLSTATQFAPSSGKTILNIGQNYADEWDGFASGDKIPAGISVYGDIYSGGLNSDSKTLLQQYSAAHK